MRKSFIRFTWSPLKMICWLNSLTFARSFLAIQYSMWSISSLYNAQISPLICFMYVCFLMQRRSIFRYTGIIWFLLRRTKYGCFNPSGFGGTHPDEYSVFDFILGMVGFGKIRSTYFHSGGLYSTFIFGCEFKSTSSTGVSLGFIDDHTCDVCKARV